MSKKLQNRIARKGAALLLFVLLFMAISMSLVLTIGKVIYDEYVNYQLLFKGKESYFAVEAALDDAVYRYRYTSLDYSSSESFTLNGIDIETTVTVDVGSDETTITAEANNNSSIRSGAVELVIGSGVSFGFGLHSGNGGINMQNTSGVRGNIFSNGVVVGSSNTQNIVYGSVISAGASGLVESLRATGTVRANKIENVIVDDLDVAVTSENAYYQTIIASTVNGSLCSSNPNCYPGSDDKAPRAFPVSDSEINDWKDDIETNGTVIAATDPECTSGAGGNTYEITSDTTIGNLKVECNMQIKNSVVTFEGPLWVAGNLDFDTGPIIIASSSLGQGELPIIVDAEDGSAPYDSDLVTVNTGTTFTSATTTSYIFLIAMNKGAEEGGSEKAIDLGQTASGRFVAYAPHGLIEIGQSTSLKAVTAYKIRLFNSAEVVYEEGLSDSTFEGSGGGYSVVSWLEL